MTCEICSGPATQEDRCDVFDCYLCRDCVEKALTGWKRQNLTQLEPAGKDLTAWMQDLKDRWRLK